VWAKFLVLGLGLLFLGKQEVVEPTLEVGAAVSVPLIGKIVKQVFCSKELAVTLF
jgi:hypothetical protein